MFVPSVKTNMTVLAGHNFLSTLFAVITEQDSVDVIHLYLLSQTMFYGPITKTRSACSLPAVNNYHQQVY